MPIEMLRGLDLNGSLKVGKLTINKLHAEQLQVTIKARKGKLETTQKIGKFYQGKLHRQGKSERGWKKPGDEHRAAPGKFAGRPSGQGFDWAG